MVVNIKNLKPCQSKEEARERGKKGGIKSGEIKRERKTLRASFKNFIKVFYFYLKNENFIFKDFHNILINKLENIVFNTSEAKNLAISISPRTGKSAIIK